MKRTFAILVLFSMLFAACGGNTPSGSDGEDSSGVTEITLWSYPVGGWSDTTTVSSLLTSFHTKNPDIRVSLRSIDYTTGDEEVEKAIKGHTLPDVIFEGPERLVANWGARGLMADISNLWNDKQADDITEVVEHACHDSRNHYYIYPLCMTTHCMAINYDMFKEADALKYINEDTHTWKSTDAFFQAIEAVSTHFDMNPVAKVYCNGQAGDQGTRALVTNLGGGTFSDPLHTEYTVESPENKNALVRLKTADLEDKGIKFDATIAGGDEADMFCKGELAMAFCWNVNMEVSKLETINFEVFPMAFPAETEDAISLQGGIWGFGIFDKGDANRRQAAERLIKYLTSDEDDVASRAVKISRYWPVKNTPNFYENEPLMTEYGMFSQYFGDYYQITTNWAQARTAWWNMLRQVGALTDAATLDSDIAAALAAFTAAVNV